MWKSVSVAPLILINNAGITADGLLVRLNEEALGPGDERQPEVRVPV